MTDGGAPAFDASNAGTGDAIFAPLTLYLGGEGMKCEDRPANGGIFQLLRHEVQRDAEPLPFIVQNRQVRLILGKGIDVVGEHNSKTALLGIVAHMREFRALDQLFAVERLHIRVLGCDGIAHLGGFHLERGKLRLQTRLVAVVVRLLLGRDSAVECRDARQRRCLMPGAVIWYAVHHAPPSGSLSRSSLNVIPSALASLAAVIALTGLPDSARGTVAAPTSAFAASWSCVITFSSRQARR